VSHPEKGCNWLSSAWRAMPIRGSLFGERRQEPFLGRILHGIEPEVWWKREVFCV